MDKELIDFIVRAKILNVDQEYINKTVDDYMYSTKWIYLDAEVEKMEAGKFGYDELDKWEEYNRLAISKIQQIERELTF